MATLSAAQRGKIRRLSQPRELSPDEEGGELNIVPFLDIIVNILIFVLATVAVTFTSTIETTPPAGKGTGVRAATPQDSLNLTVLIVNDGYSLKASGGNVAPGCAGVGPGIAIPKKNGRYDLAGLSECAAKLKASNPAYQEEDQVFIGANPGTEYQAIIDAIDALRTGPSGVALFSNVNFKVNFGG
jgi:biopolymer transport protein ExbD